MNRSSWHALVWQDSLGEVESGVRAAWLEHTLRALIAAGGCRHVVCAWCARGAGKEEESFLCRLVDLGCVCTVWRADGHGPSREPVCGISVLTVRAQTLAAFELA